MQIPMDVLSPQTTRTDSGAGAVASRSKQTGSQARFDKMLDEKLTKHDQRMHEKRQNTAERPSTPQNADKAERVKAEQVKGETNPETEQAQTADENAQAVAEAGAVTPEIRDVTQEQQGTDVVFILEGEESVTPPQTRVDTEMPPPEIKAKDETESEAKPDDFNKVLAEKTQEATEAAPKANTDTNDKAVKETTIASETTVKEAAKETLNAKAETVLDNTKTEVAGEQAARKPEEKPDEGKQNQQSGENLKDNGKPSLLENVNDKDQTSGQQESKSYSSIEDAIRSKSDEKPAETPTSSADTTAAPPPLSEGLKPEQFKATQQMAQQASQSAVKPENLFQEMIERVEKLQTAERTTMSIQLNPEHLGKVMLEVALDAAGVHVKINAEDTNIRNSINSQLNALIQSLEEKGIAVSEVEVVYSGAGFDNLGEPGGDKNGSGANAHTGKHGKNAQNSVEYYTTITDLMDYYLDAGISSVEYRA